MAFKSFRDFDQYPSVLGSDFLVGYRDVDKEFKVPIQDIATFLSKSAVSAPNVLYVNLSGSDSNTGLSEGTAFRTIKRAAAKALWLSRQLTPVQKIREGGLFGLLSKSVNIFVRTGDYIEDNPIYLPPGCTIIGDNLRAVTVIPKNKFYDIIWVNNRCYVFGMTFRQHKYPSYAIAYPIFQFLSGAEANPSEFARPFAGWNTNTRMKAATAAGTRFYSLCGFNSHRGVFYTTTREVNNNLTNLTDDSGPPTPGQDVINPFKCAFLTRYFADMEDVTFFTPSETEFGVDFWQTQWFKNNVRRPYTLTSPYTQGGSSITQSSDPGKDDAGGGVLVDGNDVDGPLRSMVMDSFTQFNEGGKGIHIINNGYAQLVSTFTICCTEGVMVETGGTCSINTSNCSFGLSGLVATGKSPNPSLVGNLRNDITRTTNQIVIHKLGSTFQPNNVSKQEFKNDFQPYPGQVFEIIDRSQSLSTGSGFLTARNSGTYFTILTASPIFDIEPNNKACVIELEVNYNYTDDTSFINSSFLQPVQGIKGEDTSIVSPDDPKRWGSEVIFYIRSTITTSAHTMEYIGTGTTLLQAVPQKGGITDVTKEVAQDGVGKVFFTTTNQFGDFKIGSDLTIVQSTGTIEGETFRRSIIQIITPITIALSN
jgi:hypothetical protein